MLSALLDDEDTVVDLMVNRVEETGDEHFEGLHIALGPGVRAARSGFLLEILSLDATFLTPMLNKLQELGMSVMLEAQ
jgi:hypothetical protein